MISLFFELFIEVSVRGCRGEGNFIESMETLLQKSVKAL